MKTYKLPALLGAGKGGTLLAVVLFLAIAASLLLWMNADQGYAYYYHDLANNRQPCSDCHIMHYSEGGAAPAKTVFSKTGYVETTGPYAQLLLRSTTNGLCLFCHDGNVPQAPDVKGPTISNTYSDEHSGAGYFTYVQTDSAPTGSSNGHYLGGPAAPVPYSTMSDMTLSCASCHDPHGTENYRNILTKPGIGSGATVTMGTHVFRNAAPGDPPSGSATNNAYTKSNEGYKSNTSKWCTECHNNLSDHVGGGTPSTRYHHVADVSINSYATGTFATDSAHWAAGTGAGFGTLTGDSTEGIPRLRFQAAGATDFSSSQTVAAGNQVMCMTCHFAHGGPYEYGLVWPYKEGSTADTNSGCKQCHSQ